MLRNSCGILVAVFMLALGAGCIEVRDILAAAYASPAPSDIDTPPADQDENPTELPTTDDGSADDGATGDMNSGTDGDSSSPDDGQGPDFEPADPGTPTPTPANPRDDADSTDEPTTEGIPPLPEGATIMASNSGLEFFDFEDGSGDMPDPIGRVRVAYVGYLPDGTIFDSNESATFRLTNLIAGFSEGVQGMRVGGSRRLIIPPELGYGANGNPGAGIGGEDTIVFDVDLLEILDN